MNSYFEKMFSIDFVLSNFKITLSCLFIIISTFSCVAQQPSFEELRKFDNFLRTTQIQRIGVITGKINFNKEGVIKNSSLNSVLDQENLESVGFSNRLREYHFGRNFANYTLEFMYTYNRHNENDQNTNYKTIFKLITSYFEDIDYSEFKIIDRYLVSKSRIIYLPINVIDYN